MLYLCTIKFKFNRGQAPHKKNSIMKNLTKKSFLNKVNEKCKNYDEVIFISCLTLKNYWWKAIVRKGLYYIVYQNTLDWVDEIYRVNFVNETNAINKALEKAKETIY